MEKWEWEWIRKYHKCIRMREKERQTDRQTDRQMEWKSYKMMNNALEYDLKSQRNIENKLEKRETDIKMRTEKIGRERERMI